MEKSLLRSPNFKEITILETGKVFEGHWELTSEFVLPPLNNASLLFNNDGQPFDGDYDKGCFLVEGCYWPGELHYKRSTLQTVGPFDLARTHERFGNKDSVSFPRLIASRNFYDFCKNQKLNLDWWPVRVDPD